MNILYRSTWTILIVLIIGIYHQSLEAPFVYDDKIEVNGNPTIRDIDNTSAIITYNPSRILLQYTYALNYDRALQQQAAPSDIDETPEEYEYHLVNVIIHCLCAGGLLWMLVGITRNQKQLSTIFPVAIASLWVLHPMCTESVTYITGRSESLCALFCFLALGAWATAHHTETKGWLWKSFALFCTILACLTKELGLMIPLCALAMEKIIFAKSWRQIHWLSYLPFVLVMAAAVAAKFYIYGIHLLCKLHFGAGLLC